MAEEQNIMQNTKEAQKTVIAFIAGLLIGGLLVWIFAEPAADTADTPDDSDTGAVEEMLDDTEDTDETADEEADTTDENTDDEDTMETGEGSVSVSDQPAGSTVTIESAVFPTDEGWIGVRDYRNDQMGSILGVARYSRSQGLIPESIRLLRATTAGEEYAIVFYTESGDREFNLAEDVQVEGVFETFRAE